jgi:hypothetical protein
MWKHFERTGDEPLRRPCGTFSIYAGDRLLGRSTLETEWISEDGFLREGPFEPVLEHYIDYGPLFARYQQLSLEERLRLPDHKHIPELAECRRKMDALQLRLIAPSGAHVPVSRLEIVDLGNGDGRDLEVFIADESVYLRFFPLA